MDLEFKLHEISLLAQDEGEQLAVLSDRSTARKEQRVPIA